MSFDYDKLKKKQETGEQWTSYSDLFMVLSVVFLLLYVVASLRTGTHTLQQQYKNQELAKKAQDLETQIKAYNNLKEDYLEKQASVKEQEMYEQLMGKLSLLQEKNNTEASKLRAKALENEKKEIALNQYQQIIRNIINSNVLSKSKLKRRDRAIASQKTTIKEHVGTIQEKDETIVAKDLTISSKNKTIASKLNEIKNLDKEVQNKRMIISQKDSIIVQKQLVLERKQKEIGGLNKEIKKKEYLISKNNKKIKKINYNLDKEINKLRKLRKNHKLSKKLYNKEIRRIQKKSKRRIAKLNVKNIQINKKLSVVSTKVANASKQLSNANKTILEQKRLKGQLDQELTTMQNQVVKTKAKFEKSKKKFKAQITGLETQKNKLENQKSKLESQKTELENQQVELASVNQQLNQINSKLALDKNKLSVVQKKLKNEKKRLKSEQKRLVKEQKKLKINNFKLSKDLRKAQEVINAKKQIAKKIKDNFNKAGIKAMVNEKTGEVVLAFGNSFFENGQSKLKRNMKSTLNKFMPIYAESIFNDPKIAKKIKSVDIVGFASPTYGGYYVNPNSLKAKDRKAIQYNTNLSINRAKSVFNHIIDTKKLKFAQQRLITPLLKVSGRSYFSGATSRAPAGKMTRKVFCSKFDCKKEQRVIIKFELDN
jgi:DNA repair exonuclease SbcCD ATPase subunit